VAVALQLERAPEQRIKLRARKLVAGEEMARADHSESVVPRREGDSVGVLSWNLFHGRDQPPDPALLTWRSRLTGRPERGRTHEQVNRPLLDEFGEVLARESWDLALLQEAPPGWLRPLCLRTGAHGASALTSRNVGAALRRCLARWNPDLIASGEGGSNQLLARPPARIAEVRRLTLARRPERRRMLFARVELAGGGSLAVANLHATAGRVEAAASEVLRAAERATEWAAGDPLVLGGDLNVRPRKAPQLYEELERRFGLSGATAPDALDHLLTRGLEPLEPPRALEPARRELAGDGGLQIRLSDHAPVTARFSAAIASA
jgi:endonuclease/exonuclease/phosphatase family metal-dependent hydrolase